MNTKEYCTWKWVTTDFGANWRPSIKYDTPILNIISAIFFIHLVGIMLFCCRYKLDFHNSCSDATMSFFCVHVQIAPPSPSQNISCLDIASRPISITLSHILLWKLQLFLSQTASSYTAPLNVWRNYVMDNPWLPGIIFRTMFPIAFLHDFPNWGTLL